MKPYQQYLEDLTKTFDKIEYTIIPRAQNQFADALTTLASMVEITEKVWTQPLKIKQSYEDMHKRKTEASVITIEEEKVPWYTLMVTIRENVVPLGQWQHNTSYVEDNSIEGPMIAYTFVA